mgnify:FL=1
MKRMTFNSWIYYAFFCLGMLKICRGNFDAFFLTVTRINCLIREAQIKVYNDILERMNEDEDD